MLKKIKVQSRLSLVAAVLLSLFFIILCIVFVYIAYTSDFVSSRTKGDIYGFIGTLAIFIPLWLNSAQDDSEYVSDLLLDDKALTIIYTQKNLKRSKIIPIENISSVQAKLNANYVKTGKSTTLFCETTVTIKTKDKNDIVFSENPTASISFCNYSFMLRLLSIAKYLPYFTFKVNGNADDVKQDLKYYSIYGKRLSFFKRQYIIFKKYPIGYRILICLFFIPLIISIGVLIYLYFPPVLSSSDKEYLSYMEQGYKYYQNDDYENSIAEYDKAQNIHDNDSTLYYYKGLSYYYDRQFEKASEEAEKGINVLNKKSAYYRAKNFKLANNDIGLYSLLGDSEKKLKNYSKAKSAYTYVINHVKYTYTDVYFERGQCEFYLNEKESALNDFYKHKQIIEKYLEDQANSEYKDKYPTYSNKDLENINLWIAACNNN